MSAAAAAFRISSIVDETRNETVLFRSGVHRYLTVSRRRGAEFSFSLRGSCTLFVNKVRS